jgi:Tfp pilus assembly protein PilX
MKHRTYSRRSLRGSALISVLLVVLVLTVVGLGVAYFMQVEDKLSGNARTMKTSFYAAEAGLKAGESWINAGFQQAGNYLYLGQLVNSSNSAPYNPPGGGQPAYLLVISNVTSPSAAPSFLNLPVSSADASQGSFTLYVRHDPYSDAATTVNLISVGQGPGNYQRVLEEQLTIPNLTTSAQPTQGGGTPGGAGSIGAGS